MQAMNWLRKLCTKKIKALQKERDDFEKMKPSIPKDLFIYKRLILTIAVMEMKIALWQAFCKVEEDD